MTPRGNYTPGLLEEKDGLLYLRVRATPGASRDELAGLRGGALRVAVSAAPERGKANEAICRTVAKALGLRKSQVSVHAGERSRDKTLAVEEIGRAELERRLAEAGITP